MGFAKMPLEALTDGRLSAPDLRVLGALVYLSKDAESFTAPREEVSRRTGLAPNRVSEATARLERFGWLAKRGKGGRSRSSEFSIAIPETLREPGSVSDGKPSGQQGAFNPETLREPGSKTLREPGRGNKKRDSVDKEKERGRKETRPTCPIPSDFRPDEKSRQWIESFGLTTEDAKPAIHEFVSYWSGIGTRRADWQATFRNNPAVKSTLLQIKREARRFERPCLVMDGKPY
jgi:hypothetical protein